MVVVGWWSVAEELGGQVLGSRREGSEAKLDCLSRLRMKKSITSLLLLLLPLSSSKGAVAREELLGTGAKAGRGAGEDPECRITGWEVVQPPAQDRNSQAIQDKWLSLCFSKTVPLPISFCSQEI